MKNKKCLFSILSKSHIQGFKVFAKSLIKTNPWVVPAELGMLIISIDLSDEDKKKCEKIYPHIDWIKPDNSLVPKGVNTKIGISAFYKLQVFGIYNYDSIISIDCADMLFVKDISQLFSYDTPIGMVQGWTPVAKWQQFNGGLVVLNKKYRNEETYEKLKKEPASFMHDQDIINNYFDKKITKLPIHFNFSKRMIECEDVRLDKAKIIHFVGENPWEDYPEKSKFKELEEMWNEYI
jgi:lipopolysaccharide biosynthesis glycosyltransferase